MRWRIYQHKRWIIAAVFICIVIIAGVWWHERRVDPVVEGKRLSEWLGEIGPPKEGLSPVLERAIASAGADAIPLLLRMLSEDECAVTFRLKSGIYRLTGMEAPNLPMRRYRATVAFSILKTKGQSAGKELARLADHRCTSLYAVKCLTMIGGPEALITFASMLENADPEIRYLGLMGITDMGTADTAVAAQVGRLAKAANEETMRMVAIMALAHVENASLVVPLLMDIYQSETNAVLRGHCVESLGYHWQERKTVEPFLREIAEQGVPAGLRETAKKGLNRLDESDKQHMAKRVN